MNTLETTVDANLPQDRHTYLVHTSRFGTLKSHNGRIYWADCWEHIWDLVADGVATEKCYGPSTYNHSDFFVS
jgi:hypothetical protein